jgi:TolB-like protein
MDRRLAAILAADVVGYSRLMETDEAGTLAALKSRRKKVLDPLLARHRGRIVKTTGDGVLVEFASAVHAVQCAIELQKEMTAANGGVPDDRQIWLRIGVNLGDVVVEGSDLFGDGVIVAARLEALADPGAICVSGKVHDEVRGKLALAFEDLGEREIKNIAKPIRVFQIRGGPAPSANATAGVASSSRPSIAILPFTNMSGDPEQQYFSDGITEDIITELSRYRSLLVIARNACFQFRGPSVDIPAVRRALGVRYIVEGSVRKAGNRVRVTAQLIDAVSQSHIWAEKYDRDIEDIFAVQDELTHAIAGTLEGRVAASGAGLIGRKPTEDWAAYDFFLQGRSLVDRYQMIEAESFFARAVELDPGYAHAHAWHAFSLVARYWQDRNPETMRRAETCARKALSLDDNDAWSHQAMGLVATHQWQFDLAGVHYDRAMSLNPNDINVAADRANWLMRVGRPDEALRAVEAAMRRDPFPPTWIWEVRFYALYHLKRYEEAIAALRNMSTFPFWYHCYLAVAYAQAGRIEEARRAVALFLAERPDFTIAVAAAVEPYADETLWTHWREGLRKAGMPE